MDPQREQIRKRLLLSVDQVAELTGLARGTIYHYASSARIPYVRLSARCIRFELAAIEDWIAAKRVPTDD